jgi:hypothetical protein
LLDVLALNADQRAAAQTDLAEAATGIDQLLSGLLHPPSVDAKFVVSEFIKALPGEG